MERVILASSSPRRQELISLLGIPFKVVVKKIEEKMDASLAVEENVKALALQKAKAVSAEYAEDFVIGCDTVVVKDGNIIGKPKDEKDAEKTLAYLSGSEHFVYSGLAVICERKNVQISFCEVTKVKMQILTSQEIADYIATKEPLDKAGSYGIQGRGAVYIESITGDYYNVVGLPIHRLYRELAALKQKTDL